MFTFYKTPVFIGVSAVNIAVNIVNIERLQCKPNYIPHRNQ